MSAQVRSIMFITGAFVGNNCWDEWKTYFEARGYQTIAPPWPHKDALPEVLRNRHPDPLIASNRLDQLTDYYAGIALHVDEVPILVGHSIGGLIVQLLLQRGIGRLGIAIHPVPPQGIFTFKLSFLKSGWQALGFFTSTRKSYLMSFRTWRYAFTNGMTCDQQKETYFRLVVPESKLIVRDTISAAAKINFTKPHAPLLIISGSDDHTIPSSLNYTNYRKYQNSGSVTDYKEFSGHNHLVLGQESWMHTAEYILEWIKKH